MQYASYINKYILQNEQKMWSKKLGKNHKMNVIKPEQAHMKMWQDHPDIHRKIRYLEIRSGIWMM